jgi:hypothetical protein
MTWDRVSQELLVQLPMTLQVSAFVCLELKRKFCAVNVHISHFD